MSESISRKIFSKSVYSGLMILIIAILITINGFIEWQQSKSELYDLMQNQAHSIIKTIIVSSQNSIASEEQLEVAISERLLNNASFIKLLFEQNKISDGFLDGFAIKHNIFRINIFNSSGKRIFSNTKRGGMGKHRKLQSPMMDLSPIFSGQQDTIIIGMKGSRFGEGTRYVVALATSNRSAIIVNVEAAQLAKLRERGNLDYLINQIIGPKEILYYALQDSSGVVASAGNVPGLEEIKSSELLKKAYSDSYFYSRIFKFNSLDILEAVQQFKYQNKNMGILRIGLSLEYLNSLKDRALGRILLNSIILLMGGVVVIVIFLTRQRYNILKEQYQAVETFSGNVIRTVSDAIIVFENKKGVKIFNKSAEALFEVKESDALGKNITDIIEKSKCDALFNNGSTLGSIDCKIGTTAKSLLIARSEFLDENHETNIIIVIKDLTDIKKLESQLQRKERLTAMGALASGVAHEIRNPLNSISTIAQQLTKDFEPVENKEQYTRFTKIIYSEVKRINDTVTNFLRFSKPDPLHPQVFRLSDFFSDLLSQYSGKLQAENISFKISVNYDTTVQWDKNQIQQVFINLIENAKDASINGGDIHIQVSNLANQERNLEIKLSDNGSGIPPEIKSRIFNLYYTTKPSGSGIGLSIVQKIIDEHNGIISVESSDKGTIFTIQLPEKIS